MKDFVFRNDTRLYFRNNVQDTVAQISFGHKVMFVYGESSAMRNGCHRDITDALAKAGAECVEFGNSSREFERIKEGIAIAKANGVSMVIGAGGASVMDSAKLIAFGIRHEEDLRDYLHGKSPYGLERLPLVLIPTYPSSGSEYGLGAVAVDSRTGDCGMAYGIAADHAILCPRYSLTLDKTLTAYTGLVTLVQLSAAILGDRNRMSYDAGISYIRNVLEATIKLQFEPDDEDARGTILMGAALSTSSRLGIGKGSNYAYDIYEIEFLPEKLFGAPYRRSLTSIFPGFLKVMGRYHADDVRRFFHDAFGYDGPIAESSERLRKMFEGLGIDMSFDRHITKEEIAGIPCDTELTQDDVFEIISGTTR